MSRDHLDQTAVQSRIRRRDPAAIEPERLAGVPRDPSARFLNEE
jgi:hypothetical protein